MTELKIRIPVDLKWRLKQAAVRDQSTLQAYVVRLLESALPPPKEPETASEGAAQ